MHLKPLLLGVLSPAQLVLALLILAAAVYAAVFVTRRTESAGLQSGTLRSGRFERTYHVYVPPSYRADSPAPVLLAYHGFGGTGAGMRASAGLDVIGDRYGALVVYPDAIPEASHAWALSCPDCTRADKLGVDDVQFTLDLIEELGRRYSIDRSRIYATGHSLGGSFVSVLACSHAAQLAGVAIVASLLTREEEDTCQPAHPMRYLHIIGSVDPNVPWTGGGRYGYVGAEETARLWAARNGCTTPVSVDTLPGQGSDYSATVWSYGACRDGTLVRLYRLEGAGHVWPLGSTVSVLEEIGRWFFDGH